jgi:hypothetical protein
MGYVVETFTHSYLQSLKFIYKLELDYDCNFTIDMFIVQCKTIYIKEHLLQEFIIFDHL